MPPNSRNVNSRTKARYWAITINDSDQGESWSPPAELTSFPSGKVQCVKGQKEVGTDTGRPHWQLFAGYSVAVRVSTLAQDFPRCSAEPSRSEAYEQYVCKEETRVEGTQFSLG